jgi:hypothetical protein
MARDLGLEELIEADLGDRPSLVRKSMFGGIAWLLEGHLLCAVSDRGLLVRLGKDRDGWALELEGVVRMVGAHPMPGWIRADERVFGDDALRQKLLHAAIEFVNALPPKEI